MTLEEIKAKIKRIIKDIKPESRSGSLYYTGMIFGYQTVIDMLNRLEPSWHPFPEEKPTEDSLVLVQFDDGHMETQHFIYDDFLWDGNCVRIPVAWMELPKPYKKEEE